MKRTFLRHVAAHVSCIACWAMFGCDSPTTDVPDHADDRRQSDAVAADGADCTSHLVPVPEVDLSRTEEHSADQIRKAQARLRSASPDKLGHAHGELGMLYHAYEAREAAEACYRNAIALDPEDFRWRHYAAHVAMGAGKSTEAIEAFNAALERMRESGTDDSHRIAANCWLGVLCIEEGRLDEAVLRFERVLDMAAREPFAHYGLGRVAVTRGRYDQARVHLEEAHGLAPQATNVQHLLGTVYRRLGDREKAQHLLQQTVRKGSKTLVPDPLLRAVKELTDNSRRHEIVGNGLFRVGRFCEAVEAYRKSLAINPDNARIRTNLGSALKRMGDVQAAEAQYRRALELDPNMNTARFNLGVICSRNGRDEQAVESYEAVLRADQQHKDARFNLANALSRLGKYELAEDHYARVLEQDPANAKACRGQARMLAFAGRYAEAIEKLEAVIAVLPDDMAIQHDLARLLVAAPVDRVRDGERGLAMAQEVFKTQSYVAHAETVAMGYAETGRFDIAIEVQEAAISAAAKEGREDIAIRLRENLKAYRVGRPCRTPWREEELNSRATVARKEADGSTR